MLQEFKFIDQQFTATCGDLVLLSECGTVFWQGACACWIHPSQGGLRRPSTSVSTWYSISASVCSVTAPQPMSLIWKEEKKKTCTQVWSKSSPVNVSVRSVKSSGKVCESPEALTGWYLTSFGGYLKCGPKLTETWKDTKVYFSRLEKWIKHKKQQHNTCTDRAALVEWDSREIDAFKQVLIGNTLVHAVFVEYHLKIRIHKLKVANKFSDWILFWGGFLTLLGLIDLRLFSALST